MSCTDKHRYMEKLKELPDHQGRAGRHYCAGCAYEQGYNDGKNRSEPHLKFRDLKESQAGSGRHKSVECAYSLGYIDGFKKG